MGTVTRILGGLATVLFSGSIARAGATSDSYGGSFGDDWDETAAVLRHAGYRRGSSAPGPGAVVAFDDAGGFLVVGRDFVRAEEYVDAVHGRMHPGEEQH